MSSVLCAAYTKPWHKSRENAAGPTLSCELIRTQSIPRADPALILVRSQCGTLIPCLHTSPFSFCYMFFQISSGTKHHAKGSRRRALGSVSPLHHVLHCTMSRLSNEGSVGLVAFPGFWNKMIWKPRVATNTRVNRINSTAVLELFQFRVLKGKNES